MAPWSQTSPTNSESVDSTMKSLAEHLGVQDYREPETPAAEPTEFSSIKDFCEAVLRSKEYRESVYRRIVLGELPAQLEILFYYYAAGKPSANINFSGEIGITKVVREVVRVPNDDDDEEPARRYTH